MSHDRMFSADVLYWQVFDVSNGNGPLLPSGNNNFRSTHGIAQVGIREAKFFIKQFCPRVSVPMADAMWIPIHHVAPRQRLHAAYGGRSFLSNWWVISPPFLLELVGLSLSSFICVITSQQKKGRCYGSFVWNELNAHSKPIASYDDAGCLVPGK